MVSNVTSTEAEKKIVVMKSNRVLCTSFLFGGECNVKGRICTDFHGCSICRNVMHHPGDCAMFELNGRPQSMPVPDAPIEGVGVYLIDKGVSRDVLSSEMANTIVRGPDQSLVSRSKSASTDLDDRTLPPDAAKLLGDAPPDFCSRVVRGKELVDAPDDVDRHGVSAVLEQLYASSQPDLTEQELETALDEAMTDSRTHHQSIFALEDVMGWTDQQVGIGIRKTDQALGAGEDRYQHPRGIPKLAPRLLIGRFPSRQDWSTSRPYAENLLERSGLIPESPNASVALINLYPILCAVDTAGDPCYIDGTPLPMTVREYCSRRMNKMLLDLEGGRSVVTFGKENRVVVNTVIDQAKTNGISTHRWIKRLPHVSGVESDSDPVALCAARAMAEGEGRLGLFSRRTTDMVQRDWFQQIAIDDLVKSVCRRPGDGLCGGLTLDFSLIDRTGGVSLVLVTGGSSTCDIA